MWKKRTKEEKEKKVRYTFEFTAKTVKLMDDLAKDAGITKSEVLRRSLAIYSYIYREVISKHLRLVIKDRRKNLKEIVFD